MSEMAVENVMAYLLEACKMCSVARELQAKLKVELKSRGLLDSNSPACNPIYCSVCKTKGGKLTPLGKEVLERLSSFTG